MSYILQYYKPSSRGSLTRVIPSRAIESANKEVEAALVKQAEPRKRGKYKAYTSMDRATIAKYSLMNGVGKAAHKFSISESTVRTFKLAYIKEREKKRKAGQDTSIVELPQKKRGRPFIVGERMDAAIQQYLLEIRRLLLIQQ